MSSATPLIPLWLSSNERLELLRIIANFLETSTTLSNESKEHLQSVQSELSVAAARDGGTKISFAKLRKVIGQEDSSVPVKLSASEKQAILDNLDLPIDLKQKLFR